MWSLRAGKIVFLGATCGFLAAAVHVSWLIGLRQADLQVASHCAVCAAASQVELEFARLEQKIAAAPGSISGPEDVRLRYDRLAERVSALDATPFRDFAADDPASAATLRHLIVTMGQLAPLVERIDRPGVGETALAAMAPLDFELSRMAAAADRSGEARSAGAQTELAGLHRTFTAIVAILFAFGAALLGLLGWHNRQLGIARDGLHGVTEDLRGASARLAAANGEVTAVNGQLQERNAILSRRDREMGLQNARFDAALNNMSLALCMVDAGDRLVIYNQRFADLFGLDFAPIPGILFADLLTLASRPHLRQVHGQQRALSTAGAETGFVQELAPDPAPAGGAVPGPAAERRTLSVSHRPMPGGGWVATYEDITQRRQDEARIAYLAHHDPLTGLANRTFFVEQVDAAVADALRRGGRVAVHCLDVDGIRDINEGFGHPAGDALLRDIGRRLEACAGGDTVARLGGDEFAVLQTGAGPGDVEALATRLLRAFAPPFTVGGAELSVSASAGHAAAPSDAASADALMKNADLALTAARLDGGGAWRAFAPDLDAARRARRALEADLRRALPNGELEVFFQPLVDVRRIAIAGFEALLRWRHPARGMVSPVEFVPVAEEIGLIAEIGEWVLREACARAARWSGEFTVAVNLSPAQFGVRDLVAAVDDALARSGLRPNRLELEITESVLLGDGDGTLSVLHALRSRGIRIAMDDFGTGYSSLSYLRRFPFDKIKIDQSFVRDLSTRPDCIKIVHSIAALGASLGITTIAEGVETAEQFEQLQAAGCDQVQGFHFGHPQPADALRFTLDPGFGARTAEAA